MLNWWRNKRSPVLLWGCLAAVIFAIFALFGDQGLLRLRHLHQRIERLNSEIATIDSENQRLTYEIESLEDPSHLEKVVRDELGYLRPDEIVYYVVETRP